MAKNSKREPPAAPTVDFHKSVTSWTAIVGAVSASVGTVTAVIVGAFQIGSGTTGQGEKATNDVPSRLEAPNSVPTASASTAGAAIAGASPLPGERKAARPLPYGLEPIVVVPPTPAVQVAPPPDILAVPKALNGSGLRVRKEPNPNSETVAIIEQNEEFKVSERDGDYYYVMLKSGTRGFVHVSAVTLTQFPCDGKKTMPC